MTLTWVLVCLLLVSNALWILEIPLMKKDLDSLAVEFRKYLKRETNSLLTISTHDRHMRNMAAEINTGLKQLRQQRNK